MKRWSGRRDSNPRRPAWEAGILPLNYSRSIRIGYLLLDLYSTPQMGSRSTAGLPEGARHGSGGFADSERIRGDLRVAVRKDASPARRAQDTSPRRKPWEMGRARKSPRRGRKMAPPQPSAPFRGFVNLAVSPRLAPWAMFFRSHELWFAAFPHLHFCVAHPLPETRRLIQFAAGV